MIDSGISIVPATEAMISAIVSLLLAQRTRQSTRDPSLHMEDSLESIDVVLREQVKSGAVVALHGDGRIRGYAHPSVWMIQESILLSFLTGRNGVVEHLVLPDPEDEDTETVASLLLLALDHYWHHAATLSDLVRWPSSDFWLEELLLSHGFQVDSICAVRSCQIFFSVRSTVPSGVHIRTARAEDEAALLELFQEELCFHEHYTPFVRYSPVAVRAFQRKLSLMWEGKSIEESAPLVLVAEHAGLVVAMAESTLLTVKSQLIRTPALPHGRILP
jgi:hypothetical protein